ncbi:hypothetical protein SBP1_gp083 [Vibrio virus vB_VspP_SBP1]|uniref:Uncharacterized protein n=1 Tax=Vibrio virus vB_VspP_SBP1 TaxID=2500581 RepID=A0A3T0IIL8_9CAUD|nr:hypothetical protein KNU36_gp046 [Vibrio virus vB_VspP_SBP1]AZU99675.1 hypothetical protein SBP1_gp083 [Vibrio virus vB_VspP_SBP1]
MSKLSNTKRADAFGDKVKRVVAAIECTVDVGDFIIWGGLNIGILTSRGDWQTGEVTEFVMISVRGLPIEKELMTHLTLHDIPFVKHDRREEPGKWNR